MLFDRELQRITDLYGGKKTLFVDPVIVFHGVPITLSWYDGEAGYYQYEMSCKVLTRVELNLAKKDPFKARDTVKVGKECLQVVASSEEELPRLISDPQAESALESIFSFREREGLPLPLLRLKVVHSIFSKRASGNQMLFTGIPTGSFEDPRGVEKYLSAMVVLKERLESLFPCAQAAPG